jgi:hypothetical protein
MQRRPAVFLAVAAAALPLGACSGTTQSLGLRGNDVDTPAGKAVAQVVQQFSESKDAQACNLLTPGALFTVYGAKEHNRPRPALEEPPPAIALATCRQTSRRFKGQPIDVRRVKLIRKRVASVDAYSTDGKKRYQLVVRRNTTGRWLIDSVIQK